MRRFRWESWENWYLIQLQVRDLFPRVTLEGMQLAYLAWKAGCV